jgi:hypothetical protein
LTEIWKPIDHYPYEVSNLGSVRRLGKTEPIAVTVCQKRRGRYAKVDLWYRGRRKTICVHRLVAAAFLPPPAPHQLEVNHFDLDTLNNTVENLEWLSRTENEQHKRFMMAFDQFAAAGAGSGSA